LVTHAPLRRPPPSAHGRVENPAFMTPGPATAGDPVENRAAVRVSIAAGLATAAVGAVVLGGWAGNVQSFKTIYGPITMKTNTAIGLVLCGLSLAVMRWSPR